VSDCGITPARLSFDENSGSLYCKGDAGPRLFFFVLQLCGTKNGKTPWFFYIIWYNGGKWIDTDRGASYDEYRRPGDFGKIVAYVKGSGAEGSLAAADLVTGNKISLTVAYCGVLSYDDFPVSLFDKRYGSFVIIGWIS